MDCGPQRDDEQERAIRVGSNKPRSQIETLPQTLFLIWPWERGPGKATCEQPHRNTQSQQKSGIVTEAQSPVGLCWLYLGLLGGGGAREECGPRLLVQYMPTYRG